jgi:hypothetical protein
VQWFSPSVVLEEGMLGIYDLKDSDSPLSFQIVKPGTSVGDIFFKIPHSILPAEHYEMRWFSSQDREVPVAVAHLKTTSHINGTELFELLIFNSETDKKAANDSDQTPSKRETSRKSLSSNTKSSRVSPYSMHSPRKVAIKARLLKSEEEKIDLCGQETVKT